MKYMLLMQGSQAESQEWVNSLSAEEFKAHIDFMGTFNEELTRSGELVDAQGLAGPEQAIVVRAGAGGAPVVTDGPFPETKEFLAGYWVVDCDTPERAVEIAARASAAPGKDGAPVNIPIEVRQIMQAPNVDV
ncbi:hypothetical protein G1H11_08615 [Phytoactinopolyspora alkaliphila]|uniref:YCII-related domain-containing protein n=1 Tax=Phytoactinopolyspora alkaliphila TaxID=1783498 RepID=A0A6N9YKB0_9ACTN|nr:YciI family protein [Phytoactinopolyspora alkaliphila]NED95377.1 hypothetical protein [Phytoactinopolyspora alkaliphila]